MADRTVEVVVIGAGFAGLAAAQVLGRAQREVLLIGTGPTRNAEAEHAHNVLTRDGTPPAELLRLGMAEVRALPSVAVREEHVEAVHADGDGGPLRVQLAGGDEVRAEVVLLATGARDVLPDVPGLNELWGKRAHSCPFCDAEAYAGRRLLILSDDAQAPLKMALLAGWTDQLRAVDPTAIAHIGLVNDEVGAQLHDGSEVTADGVFVGVTPVPRVDCVAGLPLARRGPYVAVDGEGRTSVPGLWAAGDCAWKDGEANPGGQVVASMAAGARAATWIVFDRLGISPPAPPPVETPAVAASESVAVSQFWEQHYGQRNQIWSGRPNQRLIDEVADMTPGTALDLGCGEGADAVWLAEQGWHVVAVDVSRTALARGARAAEERGVADRIEWRACDLGVEFPHGQYDLVSASYLLSPVALPRTEILKAAAAATRPGGVLLIVSHTGFPPGAGKPEHHLADFPTPQEQLADLDLPADEWVVEAAEEFDAPTHGRDGLPETRVDNVLRLRRRCRARRTSAQP